MDYSLLSSCVADIGSNISATRETGVSCVAFDLYEELLWMANISGHLTSYYSYNLDKYTSFHIDAIHDIRHVLTSPSGVLSLTKDSLRLSRRRGLTQFTHKSELLMRDMQCMTLLPSGLLLMAGHQEKMIELDVERVKHVRVTDVGDAGCVVMRQHPRFVCLADPNGKITIRDTNSLKVQREFQSHSILSSFDVCGNYLITCGYSERHGNYMADQFLMVYDVRMMKAISPISMPNFSPYLLKFLPKFAAKCVVVSQTGHFQMIDVTELIPTSLRYIHNVQLPPSGASITAFDVSATGQAFAFGDDHNYIYLYGACNEVVFNMNSKPTEFADPIEPIRSVPISDEYTPLSEICQFPYYAIAEKLLSDMSPQMCVKTYRPTPAIDPEIVRTMRMVGSIGYAPNHGKGLNLRSAITADSTHNSKRNSPEANDMPHRYYFLEPNHNKVDKDEYDFGRYNHSPFTGLDSTLPNSYSNNMIQSLYFIPQLRASIIGHICKKEYCLICELGFLFHMLDMAPKHIPCQASNFLRAFRTMPEASALNLIFPDDETMRKQINYSKLSQQWLRFILSQLHSEASKGFNDVFETEDNNKSDKCESTFISDLFSLSLLRCYKCKCDHKWEQPHNSFPITLIYPNENVKCSTKTFVDLLKHSILTEQTIQTYCEQCSKYQHVVEKREAKAIPDILAINTGLDNEQAVNFWKSQIGCVSANDNQKLVTTGLQEMLTPQKACRYGNNCNRSDCKFSHQKNKEKTEDIASWIPFNFNVIIDEKGKLDITDSSDTPNKGYVEYELMNVTSVVKKNDANIGNIVSAVKVDKMYLSQRSAAESYINEWFLFNHYSINPISTEEVVSNDLSWKLPSILIYVRKDLNSLHQNLLSIKSAINSDVFGEDICLATKARRGSISFSPLKKEEMPKKDDIVAMDAEFVTLNQEETELRADGTRATIRPSQKCVARISCVRGFGTNEGQTFIDDYIATQDQVADYMTKFSGIQPGDLEVGVSSKHLTTLKSTYLKLRFLADNGVIFVGHGLRNDFRVINLVVPQEQVIDTVLLFQSPNVKRMVSLKFLAWHFLAINIQSETHDSVEDAKTALQLYRKYLELKSLNCIDEAIEELYEIGRNSGWRVPGNEDSS